MVIRMEKANKDVARIKELTELLNRASKAYYAEDKEIISNYEYDKLYDELAALEEETGIVLSASPTRHVGYEAVDELPKERHERPMLSLGKTKGMAGGAERVAVMEAGWADHSAHLFRGENGESGNEGEWGSWGSDYQQCESIPEYPSDGFFFRGFGAPWGSNHYLFRF